MHHKIYESNTEYIQKYINVYHIYLYHIAIYYLV